MTHTRRMFVAAGAAGLASSLLARAQGMSLQLSCGAIGVKASQPEAIDYAARFGFDSVDADGNYLRALSAADLSRLIDTMREKKVAWAIAGLPVDFRKDDAVYPACRGPAHRPLCPPPNFPPSPFASKLRWLCAVV